MFWLNIYRDFTPKNKDVLEFLLVFQQQCRQLTFLRQITLYKDGNFLFPKMATQGKCRELIDNFLKCSITANYENDASRCQAINQNIFRHLLWTLAHRELKIIIHNKGKTSSNVSWWYIQIYIYNLYCGYAYLIPMRNLWLLQTRVLSPAKITIFTVIHFWYVCRQIQSFSRLFITKRDSMNKTHPFFRRCKEV